jgi:HPt (histidine-containing phosphotransfer) domain-containing protein
MRVPGPLFGYFEAEMLPQLRTQVATMHSAAQAGDHPTVRSIAHRLRGSALSFGLVKVDELVQRILTRTDAYATDTATLQQHVSRLRYVCDETASL